MGELEEVCVVLQYLSERQGQDGAELRAPLECLITLIGCPVRLALASDILTHFESFTAYFTFLGESNLQSRLLEIHYIHSNWLPKY